MRRNAFGILGCLGLAVLGCSSGAPLRSHLGHQRMPIIGGAPDTTHQAVVSIFGMSGGGGTECTGTIFYVDGKKGVGYVITAAHCVLDEMTKQPTPPQSVVQANDYNDMNAVQYSVLDAQADPLYQGMDNDFAIVRFQGATAQTPTMALMTPDQDKLQGGETVDFIGYGTTNGNDPNNSNTLRNHVKGTLTMVTPLTLEYDQTSGGPCSGDSGGPSISLVNGHELVSGVTSYGDPTCVQYGVSGRVSAVYASFIQPFMQQHGITLGAGMTTGAGGAAGAGGATTAGGAAGSAGTGASGGPGAGGSTVGAGGTGTGGSTAAPLCQAPAVSPSTGSCIPPGSMCNPVTNAGCPTGQACDFGMNGGYACYPPPNDAVLCGACNNTSGPFCGGTLTCIGTLCARFCCDASDCGGGNCSKADGDGTVGICVASSGQGAGGSGAGGSGAAGSGAVGNGAAGSGTAGSGAAVGAGPVGVGGAGISAGAGGASSGSPAAGANTGAWSSGMGDGTAANAAPRSGQSGGCSAGKGGAEAPSWPLLGVLGLALRRRRRTAPQR